MRKNSSELRTVLPDHIFSISVIFLYSIVTLVTLYHHELFRDEAQAWLIARDLNPFQILLQMRYEGSPALWHFILFPFAHLGAPYWTISVIHWIIAFIIVVIFVFKAPFSKITKILFVFSYFMVFEYVIRARNYNITILLLFLIAIMFENRMRRSIPFSICIALLFNINVHSFGAAAALSLILLNDYYSLYKKRNILGIEKGQHLKQFMISFIIITGGGILALFQTAKPSSAIYPVQLDNHNESFIDALIKAINQAFFSTNTEYLFLFFIGLFFLISIFIFQRKNVKVLLFLFLSISCVLAIVSITPTGGKRHHGLILIFIIFSIWISHQIAETSVDNWIDFNKNRFYMYIIFVLNMFLLWGVVSGGISIYKELKYNFSDSKDIANFIHANGLEQYEIVAYPSFVGTGVVPFLIKEKIWFPDIENYGSFVTWNEQLRIYGYNLSAKKIVERINKNFGKNEPVVLILNNEVEVKDEDLNDLKPLYQSNKETIIKNEKLSLYLLNSK